jgi:DNA-binding transcriptional MerR regulator
MPAPDGLTSSANYGDRHVEAVRRYQFLRSAGYRPSEIKEILKSEKRMTIQVCPGIFLSLDADVMTNELKAEEIGAQVSRLLGSLQGKET